VCGRVKDAVFEKPERPVVGVAEPPAGIGHLVEYWLQPLRARDRPKHATDRPFFLAEIFDLTSQLRLIAAGNSH
jgi:hypothetical protein